MEAKRPGRGAASAVSPARAALAVASVHCITAVQCARSKEKSFPLGSLFVDHHHHLFPDFLVCAANENDEKRKHCSTSASSKRLRWLVVHNWVRSFLKRALVYFRCFDEMHIVLVTPDFACSLSRG